MSILRNLSKIHNDSLFRNSLYLMLATAAMAGFGFFFWLINARLFTTVNIGIATTLISVMSMIATLSLVGFNATFIRYLPASQEPNNKLNTGFITVAITAIFLSTIFVVFVKNISPSLEFVSSSPLYAISFIFFCVMASLNILTDAVFLAGRQAKYTFIINVIFSAIKMLLPLAFVGWGAIGIFIAAAFGQTIGLILSVIILIWKFNYRPHFIIKIDILKRVWKFSISNYVSGIFNMLPMTVLPLIITNNLGAESAAYFYVVMMIGNLLYVIPRSITNSLFAESSNDEQTHNLNIKKSIKIILALLTPAVIILLVAGNPILKIFGNNYADRGTYFLYIIAFTGFALSAANLFGTLFQVKNDHRSLIIINIIYSATIISLSYALLPFGLVGVGFAWLSGNIIAGLAGYFMYHWRKNLISDLPFLIFDIEMWIRGKIDYFIAILFNGFKNKKILFFPDKPQTFHIIYSICHRLGYKITLNTKQKVDLVMAFSDTTFRPNDSLTSNIIKDKPVINLNCSDISKERVEKIFTETFGYSMKIDPRLHQGKCVKKSNDNAKHDGKVIDCPAEPEAGFIYQKIINNIEGALVSDIRVPIFGNRIPFIMRRYRSAADRFDHTQSVVLAETSDELNENEVNLIIKFSNNFGLDYGELDVLRDKDDKKLYIVDVNNTPANPLSRKQLTHREYKKLLNQLSASFKAVFV